MQKRFYKLQQIWFDEDYKCGSTSSQRNKQKRHYKRKEKRKITKLFEEKYK